MRMGRGGPRGRGGGGGGRRVRGGDSGVEESSERRKKEYDKASADTPSTNKADIYSFSSDVAATELEQFLYPVILSILLSNKQE